MPGTDSRSVLLKHGHLSGEDQEEQRGVQEPGAGRAEARRPLVCRLPRQDGEVRQPAGDERAEGHGALHGIAAQGRLGLVFFVLGFNLNCFWYNVFDAVWYLLVMHRVFADVCMQ